MTSKEASVWLRATKEVIKNIEKLNDMIVIMTRLMMQ